MKRELEGLVKTVLGEMPVGVDYLNQERAKRHMARPTGGTSRARLNLAHEQ